MEMANIIKIARLILELENEQVSRDSKLKNIIMHRDQGVITDTDAIELVIEYL